MKIDTLPLGHIAANCYMLSSDGSAIVIDPGVYSQTVEDFLTKSTEKECMILLTHAHFDHICGAKQLRDNTGVKIAVSKSDVPGLLDTRLSLSDRFHAHQIPFSADIELNDGDIITVGNIEFKAISTPGHTAGGMCFLTENVLFSGDTLFAGTVGRTDFEGADTDTLLASVNKLMRLDDKVTVYPGHGEPTSIGRERLNNPYVRGIL